MTINQNQLRFTISNTLLQIGIPHNLSGFKYLSRAVDIAIQSPMATNTITKNIYAVIAMEYNSKIANVERAIRNAIKKAWSQDKISFVSQLFSIDDYPITHKPSNSEIITLLAERVPFLATKYVLQGVC